MNIGILTFHEGINHGGYFQSFAMLNYLSDNGFQTEIINYKNRIHYINEYKAFFFTKNPILLFNNIKKILKFRKDQKKLNLSKFATNNSNINIEKYDTIIIGSDIVWNYEWDFLGKDSIYFGEKIEHKRLIAYAPSCGAANINNIPLFVKSGLPKFSEISVRDENTANMVLNVLGRKPPIVADPTLIYDFPILDTKNVINNTGPYLLVYAYSLRKIEIDSALKFAKDNGLKTISIAYSNVWCDENHINVGPFEWLAYFQNAQYVLTSTFHGTIFSIKCKKSFVTSSNEQIYNKVQYLLESTGLMHRLINNTDFTSILKEEINYATVDSLLAPFISMSKEFLLKALS
jgi:hypothetical protein